MRHEVNQFRRRFFGTAAMTLAAGRLGLFEDAHAQSRSSGPGPMRRPYTSFASRRRSMRAR